ncbi:type I toxin-antitoxin system SymE family toxin [Clostridiales bacterium AF36-10]|jgi:toxic protein SymE|nr:type I toxin-antitoxin system SymE family toxin [Clostridiales bacterium AF36-10]
MCEADDSLIFLRIFQKLVECTAESIYGAMPVYEKECKSMAKVTRKDFRELTVSEATNYGRRTALMLRIQGLWLQELGFNVGDPVLVKCEDGKLIITPDTTKVELMEAEKAFMEEETKKLQERFLKEKKELHARFVAERRVEYEM